MTTKITGKISSIAGPVVKAKNMSGSKMYDVVRVGKEQLLGEIIQLERENAIIQVYEETTGLKPEEPVVSTQEPLTVDLGPGLLNSILDGVARPLQLISKKAGDFITRGIDVPTLDLTKKYAFTPKAKKGDKVNQGDILGTTPETDLITHKVMVPPGIEGTIVSIEKGSYNITQEIAKIKTPNGTKSISMMQKWPVRKPRPFTQKLDPSIQLVTGQRVFDTAFPIAKGGTAAIPGPFGAGKTVSQQQLAKWADAEVIVYIGCGERGNEMTEVLTEFPELLDPKTGKPLMERTVLIANTSNMPVAAREASVYTGITIAEYYRDMGYDVALMADSTSRWAEAMREISSRLEEMPGEEGYPAYLASRLAQFYERAGRVTNLNNTTGSVSVIGAVSPPGGDFSEPVTQNTLRMTKVFWALDAPLAYKRHFPAINWLTSYTLYIEKLEENLSKEVAKDFLEYRTKAMTLLQKEAELQEIVQLVGPDALPEEEKIVLFTTKSLREDFLQQNAYHEVDSYCSMEKQYLMLKTILDFNTKIKEAVAAGAKIKDINSLGVNEKIARMKYVKDYKKETKEITEDISKELSKVKKKDSLNANTDGEKK